MLPRLELRASIALAQPTRSARLNNLTVPERQLRASHAIYLDETRLIQSAREAAQELAELLEADRQPETEVAEARPV